MEDVTRKAVNQLMRDGHVILQVNDNEKTTWFEVYSWTPGYFNTAESVEFNVVEGIDITAFLNTHAAMYHNYNEFVTKYEKFMEDAPVVRCEFTRDCKWYKWQLATGANATMRRR